MLLGQDDTRYTVAQSPIGKMTSLFSGNIVSDSTSLPCPIPGMAAR